MSKGNMLLGHARGKVGDLVFSRVNGQQVTRARAAVVKNPQTEAQMIQRILLNTIIQAYSRMSTICDHSFEGVPTGQKSMSAFMTKNLSYIRSYVAEKKADGEEFDTIYAFAPVGTNLFTMNQYIVSTGSLPQVDLVSVSALNGAKVAITAAGSKPTYQEVIDALGLQRGDQLTFIGQLAFSDSRAAFKFARVILDPRNPDGTEASLDVDFLDANNAINYPSPRNEGDDITFSFATNQLTFTLAANSQFGAAVIVSRQKTDGTWLRSNAQITLDASAQIVVRSYSMQDALDALADGGLDLMSERYLNNARRVAGSGASQVFAYTTAGGTAVNLVGTRMIAAVITPTEGDPINTQLLSAYDDQGVDHIVYSDNSYSQTYGKVCNDPSGTNSQTAWAYDFAKVTTPAGVSNSAVAIHDGDNGNILTDPLCVWLLSQGLNPASVF